MTIVKAPFKNLIPLRDAKSKSFTKKKVDMSSVVTLILGGGAGTRLYPLTLTRCKPAISFGGKYRLIDIPMANALNSGCQKIYVLTQFLSHSLHQHIQNTYRKEHHSQGFIEILTAEQKPKKSEWYQGTADAIRQNIDYITESDAEYFLILAGDQIYQMNYGEMVEFAEKTDSAVVVGALPVDEISAKRMGIMQIDLHQKITNFVEKPTSKQTLEKFSIPKPILDKYFADLSLKKPYLGSMGIYLFRRDVLLTLLEEDLREDFGKHIIPTAIKGWKTSAFIFNGHWEDVGTIESFYRSNLSLTTESPLFDSHSVDFPLYSVNSSLPPAQLNNTQINSSIICEGSIINGEKIENSIIGPRSKIGKGTVIQGCYLFGNDYPHALDRVTGTKKTFGIGENCLIQKAIIDKQVKIGNNVQLINRENHINFDGPESIFIRDGIIIVNRGAHLPDGLIF